MLPTRDPPQNKRLKMKGQKKYIFQANGHEKKAGVAILRQNRLENKGHNKKQRRSLYNI